MVVSRRDGLIYLSKTNLGAIAGQEVGDKVLETAALRTVGVLDVRMIEQLAQLVDHDAVGLACMGDGCIVRRVNRKVVRGRDSTGDAGVGRQCRRT